MAEQKTIKVSPEVYDSIQELKEMFSEITWEKIKEDEDVLEILISWFIESLQEEWWKDEECEECWWKKWWGECKCK